MTGNLPAVETPKNQNRTKRATFREFLAAYRSPVAGGDEIADLARDVAHDAKAPRQNTRLIDYLIRRGVDGRLIGRAVNQWKAARDE